MKLLIKSLLSILVSAPASSTILLGEPPVLAEYAFVLDGKKIDPPIWSLRGTHDFPQAGDLVQIGELLVTLTLRVHPISQPLYVCD